ncbi:hypothetical protein RM549_03150 [Salegentibacter sp. F188]|uniref:Uncharacterized protein n=1 Tax=Autumnicola patrickiae TaxID=3075591 RepID=A0ABU3DYG1_9FLAO|nr:hypothetical protein [Salegentibacter sp. F188]MDT0688763.1 hypothetical protein [Salegentibacter sp. F188]
MPNNGFKWRPNDNSATTNLRYTLEAEKWMKAVSSAQGKARPRSIWRDLGMISMLFELVFSVILLILLGLLQLITALIRFVETNIQNKSGSGKEQVREKSEPENIEEHKPDVVWNIKKEKRYPSGLQLIFWNSWGEVREIWRFLLMFVFIFACVISVFYLLSFWSSGQVHIGMGGYLVAGAISLWNAFIGSE